MVSQDSSSDPASSILHQFIISSDPISSRTNLEDNGYTSFQSDGRNRNSFPQSLGVLPTTQLLGERISRAIDQLQAHAISEDSEPCSRRHLMNLLGAARETDSDHQAQRLCLTLGSHLPSHMLIPSLQYRQRPLHSDPIGFNYLISGEESREIHSPGLDHTRNDYPFADSIYTSSSTVQNKACSTSYEIESFANFVANSRYLKPAQSLLEEVVSVGGKGIDFSSEKTFKRLARNGRRGTLGVSPEMQAEVCSNGLAAEKQELQIRIVKLTALLDEVDSRYEQYYHQMEQVVSSFEVIAGLGAAKSYTALALQAMSRHFRSLRDAIAVQINVAKSQASQDIPRIRNSLSQLSLFDQEGRHNRASLQQLGMMQNRRQPWRPIRGLPENSVAILRSWLFEHFLHPYPNESEKLILASQTGLTKNQISNWFINARVRLWKPMIEEMYKEEFAENSEDPDPSSENVSVAGKEVPDHSRKQEKLLG